MDFDLVGLLDVDVEEDVVFLAEIGDFGDFYFGVLEALLGIVLLDELLGAGDDVGSDLLAADHGEVVEEVFLLAAGDAGEA